VCFPSDAESSFSAANCCAIERCFQCDVKGRRVNLTRSFGIGDRAQSTTWRVPAEWRETDKTRKREREREREISLSALRYPTFLSATKQNRGCTRNADSPRSSLHRVGVPSSKHAFPPVSLSYPSSTHSLAKDFLCSFIIRPDSPYRLLLSPFDGSPIVLIRTVPHRLF